MFLFSPVVFPYFFYKSSTCFKSVLHINLHLCTESCYDCSWSGNFPYSNTWNAEVFNIVQTSFAQFDIIIHHAFYYNYKKEKPKHAHTNKSLSSALRRKDDLFDCVHVHTLLVVPYKYPYSYARVLCPLVLHLGTETCYRDVTIFTWITIIIAVVVLGDISNRLVLLRTFCISFQFVRSC